MGTALDPREVEDMSTTSKGRRLRGLGRRVHVARILKRSMSGRGLIVALARLVLLAVVALAPHRGAWAQEDWYSVKDLKDAIVEAISDARKLADQAPYFLVKKVELELKGTISGGVGAGFSIPIFGASIDLGAEAASSAQETLALVLVPAETVVVGGEAPEINLAAVIADLKQAFRTKKDESPEFIVASVNYEKVWTLQFSVEGRIDFVIASAKVSISKEKQQRIKFTLCETVNLRDCAAN